MFLPQQWPWASWWFAHNWSRTWINNQLIISSWDGIEGSGLKDYQDFIRKWNKNSARTFQITGQRASSLKLLFDLAPMDVVAAILAHVGRLSFANSVWTDDNLASKRMYTGYQFASRSKKWLPRLKVTNESMMLHVEYMHRGHENTPAHMRKKPTMQDVAACAERAAACFHLGAELLTLLPIKEDIVKSHGSSLN